MKAKNSNAGTFQELILLIFYNTNKVLESNHNRNDKLHRLKGSNYGFFENYNISYTIAFNYGHKTQVSLVFSRSGKKEKVIFFLRTTLFWKMKKIATIDWRMLIAPTCTHCRIHHPRLFYIAPQPQTSTYRTFTSTGLRKTKASIRENSHSSRFSPQIGDWKTEIRTLLRSRFIFRLRQGERERQRVMWEKFSILL